MSEKVATAGPETETGKISIEALAKMTGFPVEMIKEEIFKDQQGKDVSMDELRSAMLNYIDSTLLLVNKDK